jgi:NADPH:quinone reductase-like Zn-dependent oxidoreductase
VIGFTNRRASHAEYVLAEQAQLIPRPAGVSWEQAGALFGFHDGVRGSPRGRAQAGGDGGRLRRRGGVGSIAVQLAWHTGARVIGLASEPTTPG